MTIRRAMGIDIGGSGVKGAIVDTDRGRLISERVRIATPRPATPVAVLGAAAKICEQLEWTGPVGCGFPGNFRQGLIDQAPNLDGDWSGVDLAKELRKLLTSDLIAIGNDADVAGIAEQRFGAGRGATGTVIVITLGTGLGSAVFHDGHLLPGTEIGHIEIDGHVAEHVAADSARRRENLSWEQWAKRLDSYLSTLEYLLGVDLFILGGGASKKGDKFVPLLVRVRCEVKLASMGNLAGIIGAALAVADAG